jgi:hypothetical protein
LCHIITDLWVNAILFIIILGGANSPTVPRKLCLVFAFIITSMSSYYGYMVRGGALDVGKASTNAVVNSNIMILFMDLVLSKLLL